MVFVSSSGMGTVPDLTCRWRSAGDRGCTGPRWNSFPIILRAPVLENLLRHHSVQMQEGGMPLTNINCKDMKALVAYIRSLPSSDRTQSLCLNYV